MKLRGMPPSFTALIITLLREARGTSMRKRALVLYRLLKRQSWLQLRARLLPAITPPTRAMPIFLSMQAPAAWAYQQRVQAARVSPAQSIMSQAAAAVFDAAILVIRSASSEDDEAPEKRATRKETLLAFLIAGRPRVDTIGRRRRCISSRHYRGRASEHNA